DFSWREISTYRLILSESLIVHNRCVGKENGICVNGNHYRSIRDAYESLMPNKSYDAVCRLLRHGKTSDEAFDDGDRHRKKSKIFSFFCIQSIRPSVYEYVRHRA
ncbi:MAG: hypothetical protein L0K69_05975, partial [Enterobacterales bacterium]|nr:hypothetical protein [Enterobacterales bacterium]